MVLFIGKMINDDPLKEWQVNELLKMKLMWMIVDSDCDHVFRCNHA